MKYSRQRELILKALCKDCTHPTAEQVYKIVQNEEPTISLATVYRNLNLLAEKGIIKKIEGLGNMAHFDHQIFDHFHFICNKCHKVFDIPHNVASDLAKNVTMQTGMDVESYDIVFYGICKDCQRKN